MGSHPTRKLSPEERELQKYKARLALLREDLAQWETDLHTLQTQLGAFNARYLQAVGHLLVEIDRLRAEIARLRALLYPEEVEEEEARKAEEQARATEEAVGEAKGRKTKFEAPEELKDLYRKAAKRFHPDLASDPADRARRERLMKEINLAYEAGDLERLQRLLQEEGELPEEEPGESIGEQLVRIIRKIDQVEKRLYEIRQHIKALQESDLYDLMVRAEKAEREGRDLLEEIAESFKREMKLLRDERERLLKEMRR